MLVFSQHFSFSETSTLVSVTRRNEKMCFLTHFLTNELSGEGKNIVLLLQWFHKVHQNNKGILGIFLG